MIPRARQTALVLVALLALSWACSAPITVVTPQGKIAYTADQVVQRVGELQATTIQANQTGGLPDSTAIPLVQTCVSLAKVLKTTPAGWQASVTTLWAEGKKRIPPADAQKLAAVIATVDIAIASLLGGTQ